MGAIGWPRFWQDRPEIMGRHPPVPMPSIQTLIADKGGSNLINFRPIRACVNGFRNAVFLAAIRIVMRFVGLVDGSAAILVGSPRNHGPPAAISRTHHTDPLSRLRIDRI